MKTAPKTTLVSCLLLLMFAGISWTAIDKKGAAYDEPYHALSAWLQLRYYDFRMDNEDPPLWQYWASLPNRRSAFSADFKTKYWTEIPQKLVYQWYWGVNTLYRTAGNDPAAFLHRCRFMMLILAVVLGICIACWAWQVGGPVAAISATYLFCLDPNFIAHSALMKNDVVFSLSMFLLAKSLWKAGRRLTFGRVASIAFFCVVTLTVKFSGSVAVLLVPALLGLRALLPIPWPMPRSILQSRSKRMLIAAAVVAVSIAVSLAGIWAVYGFRFRPTPEQGIWLNISDIASMAESQQNIATADSGVASVQKPGIVIDSVLFANRHGLLPQAFLAGFLFTYANALAHPSFLCGEYSMVGWWWYFPFAMLVKTPIATTVAAVIAGIVIVRRRKFFSWTGICLLLAFAMFLGAAMRSHFNVGIRHILPIYPFAYVAIGWAASMIWQQHHRLARPAVIALAAMLAVETLSAYPDYIPFFNAAASNSTEGGLDLLGDSNLDWGQDLPLLAAWQKSHTDVPLYLSYFGYEDPAFYHIKYSPLPGGYHYDPPPRFPPPDQKCVLAISATNLQGGLEPPELRRFYQQCRKLRLLKILGGSIYLFDHDPAQSLRPSSPGKESMESTIPSH